uniref:Cation efflux protein transmembrane domain-containing protein n=1 Tax=Skeletonema marinoi TaxID=267567 RepID=A0A7S2M4U9_9STRA|mmetsp:Transcript_4805/g.8264  ORF Transcript_4805/g.8264 Transcript_4805/m.8264 type:complete len:661 (+) Transcript_4805:46-2028(+)
MMYGQRCGGNLLEGFHRVVSSTALSQCSRDKIRDGCRRQFSTVNSMLWRRPSHQFSMIQNQRQCSSTATNHMSIAVRSIGSFHRDLTHNRIDVNRSAASFFNHHNNIIPSSTIIRQRYLSSKNKLPKEVIDTIKSEVDEMESPKARQNTDENDAQYKTKVKKTQDDFAEYLTGDKPPLDSFIERRRGKLDTLQASSQLEDTASSSSDDSVDSSDKVISVNKDEEQKAKTEASSDSISGLYYKFSPTDATLSDPQRHVDRRRALEQKLQDQMAVSRATTTQNVQRALAGNFVIAVAKLAAAISSGSSAMLSEFVHSVVDCGNQALLLVGLNSSQHAPDRSHPYGYGKAIYFWALVSALGTFFLGAGVSMTHAVGELMNPRVMTEVPWEVWGVLGMSFVVDGYVFSKTVQGVRASMRIDGGQDTKNMSFWTYATTKVRDPATLAVLLEDGAACLGIVLAIGGIGMTQYTGLPIFDGMAGISISALLGVMGIALVSVNHRYLIGHGVDRATREDIEQIILGRRSIDNVHAIQTQWTGPDTFSYKAEIDFDGTFLAAKLMPRYQQEFFDAKESLDRDLRVLLAWYAEDVMRAVEREIRHIEEEIRKKYPAAQYIELEPMSKDADRYAIDDGMKAQLRRVEIEVLNRYLKSLYKIKEDDTTSTPS